MITKIPYYEVKFSNNYCLLEAIENAMYHYSRAMSKLLAMAK